MNQLPIATICTLLYQAASLITSARFDRFLARPTTRFELSQQALSEVNAKLIINYRYGHSALYRNTPLPTAHQTISDSLVMLANTLTQRHDAIVRQSDRRFTVAKDTVFEDVLLTWAIDADPAIGALSQLGSPTDPRFCFDIRGISDAAHYLRTLSSLIISRCVLARPTPYLTYETLLAHFVLLPGYLVKGYPEDLLCHDFAHFTQGVANKLFAYRPDYCSTHILSEEHRDNLMKNGYTVINMRDVRAHLRQKEAA